MNNSVIYWARLGTGKEQWTAAATTNGICRILYPNETLNDKYGWFQRFFAGVQFQENPDVIEQTGLPALWEEFFAGKRTVFNKVPLDLLGTPFQQQVWLKLREIPFGETWTYRELAASIGNPAAVRAVGTANGANPLPVIVPCHRVVGSNRTLVGYRGGLKVKEALLRLEGAEPIEPAGHARFQF